jgi:hypothetical protein
MKVNDQPQAQGRIQVLSGLSLCKFWDLYCGKEYKIKYKSEYLFLSPHRALEGPVQVKGPEG